MEIKQIYTVFSRFRSRIHGTHHVSRHLCSGIASPTTKEEIVIPPRIERSSTDILRALASTLNTDFTAPHYKYHDDPYLIPSSNIGKRTFALAKESGRKAAQWVQQQHPELFNASIADPPIAAFMPKVAYGEDSVVSEQDLKSMIGEGRVSDAITVYELLEKNKQEISLELRQSLLELLCFYNAEDSVAEDLVEERWFRQGQQRGRERKTWKDGDIAENVFASIQLATESKEHKDPQLIKAMCTLIKGMSKYCQVDKAWEMYQTLRSEDVKIDVGTYEALIRATSFLRDGNEERWQLMEQLLRDMASSKVTPNLGTMNAVLEVLSTTGGWRQARTLSLRSLAEFKQLDIQPSLATYYFLLTIFCRERGPVSSILEEILNDIEAKNEALTIKDTKDTFFFVTAMDVCRNHLGDPTLARKLHTILHAHNNYDLIGDSYKESIYYRHFFVLLCTTEPLPQFMDIYNKYVPNIYIPEPSVMEEVVRAVELHEAWEQLPRLWADILVFDQVDRVSLITLWLNAAVTANVRLSPVTNQETTSEPSSNDILASDLCKSAAQMWEKIENQPDFKTNIVRWDGPMLGCIIQLALRAGEFDFACQALKKLQSGSITSAPPDIESIRDFLQIAAEKQDTDKAMECLEYTIDAGFPEAAILAKELQQSVQLSSSQISKLQALLGRV